MPLTDVTNDLTRSGSDLKGVSFVEHVPYRDEMLARLARFCFRHHWLTIFVWLGSIFAISGVGWGAIGPDFRTDFTLPASETKDVFDFLEERSPNNAGFSGQIVFTAPQGVNDPEVQAAIEPLLTEIAQLEGVTVTSPYTPEGLVATMCVIRAPGVAEAS